MYKVKKCGVEFTEVTVWCVARARVMEKLVDV